MIGNKTISEVLRRFFISDEDVMTEFESFLKKCGYQIFNADKDTGLPWPSKVVHSKGTGLAVFVYERDRRIYARPCGDSEALDVLKQDMAPSSIRIEPLPRLRFRNQDDPRPWLSLLSPESRRTAEALGV